MCSYKMRTQMKYKLGDEVMEDGEKLKKFLKGSSKQQIEKLINKIESLNDREFDGFLDHLKSLFR